MEPPPPPHRKSFWPLLLLQYQLWPRAPLLLLLLLLASFLCFYSLTLTTPPSLHRPPFLSSSPSPPPSSTLSTPLPSFDDHQPIGLSSLPLRSHNLTTRLDGGDDRRSSTHRHHPSKAATRDRRNGQHPNSSLPRSAGNASSYGNGTSISDVPATPPCAPPQPPQQNAGHPSNATRLVSPPPQEEKRSNVLCDLSLGRWVQDDSYPLYQPGACPFVDEGFSCRQNGRPDLDYVKWRWKPNDCDIPRLNATALLESLRGKRLVFVGDSLSRNQWESMLCILREGLADKTRVFEIHGLRITKGRGAYVFRFPDYDCRVEFYRSHFLVDEGKTSRGNKPGRSRYTVKLDKADRSKTRWRNAHILVFNTGHWWTHTKAMKKRNFFQEGDTIYPKLNVDVAFKKAINTWAEWVDMNVDPSTTQVFFRSYSPAHFRGGQWNSGGQCHTETQPIFNESFLSSYPERMQVVEEVIQHMKNPVKLLNVTRLSDYRKDGHPSIYTHIAVEVASKIACHLRSQSMIVADQCGSAGLLILLLRNKKRKTSVPVFLFQNESNLYSS